MKSCQGRSSVLPEVADLGLGLVVPLLGVVDCLLVRLVDSNIHLLDTMRVRQKNVFVTLAVLRDIASNAPEADATTRTATSACDVPVVMFLMKS